LPRIIKAHLYPQTNHKLRLKAIRLKGNLFSVKASLLKTIQANIPINKIENKETFVEKPSFKEEVDLCKTFLLVVD
jgi:hypothetical protein